MTAAVYLLLTCYDVAAVNALQISHQRLSFGGSVLVGQRAVCQCVIMLWCSAYCDCIYSHVAVFVYELNGVDTLVKAEAAEAEIHPLFGIRHILHALDAVYRDGLLSAVLIEHLCTPCGDGIHAVLRDSNGK